VNIEIKEIKDAQGRKEFVEFPHSLYGQSPYWVPPLSRQELTTLDPDQNPAFEHSRIRMWMAYNNGKPVGRIAAIINLREIEMLGQAVGRFGWFDVVDDMEVTESLLEKAEGWLRKEGMSEVKGPYGFTNFDRSGVLTFGFNEVPTIAAPYNNPYYADHLKYFGFKPEMEWVEYEINVPQAIPERIEKLAETIQNRMGVSSIRPRSKAELRKYANRIFDLLMDTYDGLHGFIPYTDEQIEYYIKNQIEFILPEYVSLISNEEDELIAFGIAMPSLSQAFRKARGKLFPFGWYHILKAQRSTRLADLLLIGVRDEYRNKGLNALIFRDIMKTLIDKGVQKVETNAELEDNQQVQSLWQRYAPNLHKRRSTYIKEL
jgi:hypothetical protein